MFIRRIAKSSLATTIMMATMIARSAAASRERSDRQTGHAPGSAYPVNSRRDRFLFHWSWDQGTLLRGDRSGRVPRSAVGARRPVPLIETECPLSVQLMDLRRAHG